MRTYKSADAGHRVCAICGKPNGYGFTTALRHMGYDVPPGTMAYAHNACLVRAQKRLNQNGSIGDKGVDC